MHLNIIHFILTLMIFVMAFALVEQFPLEQPFMVSKDF